MTNADGLVIVWNLAMHQKSKNKYELAKIKYNKQSSSMAMELKFTNEARTNEVS